VIGGAAGAFPPMIGSAGPRATGCLGIESVLMFLIIFFWTRRFWAGSVALQD